MEIKIMREKLMTLSLAALRDIAKDKNIKGISSMRKNELIDAIIAASEADGTLKQEEKDKKIDNVQERQQVYEKTAIREEGPDANGILEVMPEGFGFIRCENYLPGENDVYVAPSQIRRFGLKTGDIVQGRHGNRIFLYLRTG